MGFYKGRVECIWYLLYSGDVHIWTITWAERLSGERTLQRSTGTLRPNLQPTVDRPGMYVCNPIISPKITCHTKWSCSFLCSANTIVFLFTNKRSGCSSNSNDAIIISPVHRTLHQNPELVVSRTLLSQLPRLREVAALFKPLNSAWEIKWAAVVTARAALPHIKIEMLIDRIWNNKLNKYTFL